MKKKIAVELPQVPVGIVVSVGGQSTEPTRFSAYVWGPAPEVANDTGVKAA
jgi:hypothetical protein